MWAYEGSIRQHLTDFHYVVPLIATRCLEFDRRPCAFAQERGTERRFIGDFPLRGAGFLRADNRKNSGLATRRYSDGRTD